MAVAVAVMALKHMSVLLAMDVVVVETQVE